MLIKKYRIISKDGKVNPQLFESIKDGLKTVGAKNISKIEEVSYEEETAESSIDKKLLIVIPRKNNNEINVSNASGQSATLNRPALTKVFSGMTILEIGDDKVLESTLYMIGRYDANAHKTWKDDDKDWEWVLYHKKGKILTFEEMKNKFGEFDKIDGKCGNITYVSKLKI